MELMTREVSFGRWRQLRDAGDTPELASVDVWLRDREGDDTSLINGLAVERKLAAGFRVPAEYEPVTAPKEEDVLPASPFTAPATKLRKARA